MNFKQFKKKLPDTYQELEYIQSGSLHLQTGYIDTGLVGTDLYGCEIETCMKVTVITSYNLYYLNGAYEAGHAAQTGLIREDTEYVHSVVNMGFNTALYSGSIALSDWHTIYTSDGIQKTDGIIVGNETYGTLNNLHYLLFARSDTGVTLSPPFAMKYFWIKKNGQYIRNMIPAKRKSDNVVGMYDLANNVFYTSANQYAFIGGSEVTPEWVDSHYIHKTATDTLSLPTVIYPNASSITVGIKGNTGGVGDLVESGEHAGEYVIPIVCNSVITNIYRNAPLDISDSLTTSIPCTAGSNSFDVDTTVAPSEVTATFEGWHPVSAAHERENGQWD